MTGKKKRRPSNGKAGTLVIIGGHEDHDGDRVILKEVASLVPNGRLVLATIASHEPDGYLEKYQKSFGELGIKEVVELYVNDRLEAAHEKKNKRARKRERCVLLRWRPAPHHQPDRRHPHRRAGARNL
ncbi:hypothetical protein [Mesorhizobium sp. M7A.F.Ca.ET.027.03.2.1]|uniref:hypothetical protein n=1 Tax=Mesorhizobium sp. M7A.F.Ca.ET.027.03.2.1 TaxID=2496656 RepID=UPI001FE04E6B|nr:hypothetical protein [Mesorhizobium sp. M7A.F.Ca.ET.027.03.2.1]